MKKAIKYILLGFTAIVLFAFTAIAVVTNFILTPSKLTPIVLEQANIYSEGDIDIEAIDLSVFGSFPSVSLNLHNGLILSPDTLVQGDTLCQFEEIRIKINPFSYLLLKEVQIDQVKVANAKIYAKMDKDGQIDWTKLYKAEQEQDSVASDSSKIEINAINIDEFIFSNIDLSFINETTDAISTIENLSLDLSTSLSKQVNELEAEITLDNMSHTQAGKTLIDDFTLYFKGDILHIPSEKLITIHDTELKLNNMQALCDGTIQKDSTSNGALLDLDVDFKVRSFKDILEKMPSHILNLDPKTDIYGDASAHANIKGLWNDKSMPTVDLKATINNGKFKHPDLPHNLDKLALSIRSFIDLNDKRKSFVDVDTLIFEGANSSLDLKGKAYNILVDPRVSAKLKADLDFTTIAKAFPFSDSIIMRGHLNSDLKTEFTTSDIMAGKYGKTVILGHIDAKNLSIASKIDSFILITRNAYLQVGSNQKDESVFQGKTLIDSKATIDTLEFKSKQLYSFVSDLDLAFKSSPIKDTTAVVSMSGEGKIGHLLASSKPLNAYVNIQKAEVEAHIRPDKVNPKNAEMSSRLFFPYGNMAYQSDSILFTNAGFNVTLTKPNKGSNVWNKSGIIGFRNLNIKPGNVDLEINMPKSSIKFNNNKTILNNATLIVGESDMRLTGEFTDFFEWLKGEAILKGDYHLSSNFINTNELFEKTKKRIDLESSESDSITATIETPTDSTASSIFVVPDSIQLRLDSDIKKILFGKLQVNNIKGIINVKNQGIQFEDLMLNTQAADMVATLVYQAKDTTTAYSGFDVMMKDIRVGKLVEIMPALDTLVPMLRSVDGIVNFHVAAETRFNPDFTPQIPSITAAANIQGDSLVLMDGETFAEISKMLRFKNKERNLIDSVSVNLLVENGQIDIYPFIMSMDRYTAAIGGKHFIDMTFDYHISVLKSPVPFKMGINVTGDLDDYKVRLGKAKYKDIEQTTRTSPIDSTSTTLKHRLRKTLESAYTRGL